MPRSLAPVLVLLCSLLSGCVGVDRSANQRLTYRTASEVDWPIERPGQVELALTPHAPTGVALPDLRTSTPLFARWPSPIAPDGFLPVVLDRPSEEDVYDRLFIDADGDSSLSDEEAIDAYALPGDCSGGVRCGFGPVPLAAPYRDGTVGYHLNLRLDEASSPTHLAITSGGWYEGQITVGDVRKQCLLIDHNANGVFNDMSAVSAQADRIRIGDEDKAELRFTGEFIQVDGRLHRLDIDPSGASFRLSRAKRVSFGVIRVDERIASLTVGGENGALTFTPKNGVVRAPVGVYRPMRWTIEREDGKAATWSMTGHYPDDADLLEVGKGGETHLNVIEPVTSRVAVTSEGSDYTFDVWFEGLSGERVEVRREGVPVLVSDVTVSSTDGAYSEKALYCLVPDG